MEALFTVETAHGTTLAFDADAGDLVHEISRDPAVLLKVEGCLSILLDGRVNQHSVHVSGPVIPIDVEPVEGDPGFVALKHHVSRQYLCASPIERKVTIDRGAVGGWERFRLIEAALPADAVAGPGLPDLLRGARPYADMLLSLAEQGSAQSISLAAALIEFVEAEDLAGIVERLSTQDAYPVLFSALQARLSDGERRFEFQAAHRLADDAARYGWSIGDHSYGNPQVIEKSLGKLSIGKYCSMNDFVIILGNHVTDAVSSYPFADLSRFWPSARVHPDLVDHVSKDVVIGNDVWIGNGALILPGTVVGDGAVIGAHAVARGHVPPYAVVAGNPGRVVRYRFSEERIAMLLDIAWWTWPDWKVDRFIPLILGTDIDEFLRIASANC